MAKDCAEVLPVGIYNIAIAPWEPSNPVSRSVEHVLPASERDPVTAGIEKMLYARGHVAILVRLITFIWFPHKGLYLASGLDKAPPIKRPGVLACQVIA